MHLITGGLGFIGNELARHLAASGEKVAILDNRSRVAPRIDDLAHIPIYHADITLAAEVNQVLEEVKPVVVYHLAAIHYIPECNAKPEKTLRVNVEATLGMMRACSKAQVEHLVHASSGAVYADSPAPLSEESPAAPVDIYGWSKWFAEELGRWHNRQHRLPITLCRLFNNYGPRETNAHIIPEIMAQLRSGNELRLGNITPTRDYIHTADTAHALNLLGRLRPQDAVAVNVATGQGASVEDLIAIMGELLGRELKVVTDRSRFRLADKQVQVADVRKLESLTGWRPTRELRAGLADLLRFEGLLA
jgi:UDP-glucose 4-epimerase